MIKLSLKLVIISASLVCIIIPYFKTIYSLDLQQKSSESGLEQMVLKAEFKPDENPFLAEDGYYQVQKFGFIASNSSEICPLNNCKYSVRNTQFRPNSVGEGYVFEARLTVIAAEDGVEKPSKSEFYYFNVGFHKSTEEQRNGTAIQILKATSASGTFSFIPGIDYNVINATLLVDKKKPIIDNLWRKTPPLNIIKFTQLIILSQMSLCASILILGLTTLPLQQVNSAIKITEMIILFT